ncbi:MAG: serine O-acetyltransferase EpsC [Bacteroidales bacterium]
MSPIKTTQLPAKPDVINFTKDLCINLFPEIEGGKKRNVRGSKVKKQLFALLKPLEGRLTDTKDCLTRDFLGSLPEIRKKLLDDAEFITENDPASTDVNEVMMTYPGFLAILVYRLANSLYRLNIPLIPRIMTEYAHSVTGIDIHPGASIGSPFFIDHGTGLVIGETSVIGKDVKVYQGVTIGALSLRKDKVSAKRHPTIEDNVIIYAGSTILGGETVIGNNSIIGGNVWLTKSVPPYSIVKHDPKIKIRKQNENSQHMNPPAGAFGTQPDD